MCLLDDKKCLCMYLFVVYMIVIVTFCMPLKFFHVVLVVTIDCEKGVGWKRDADLGVRNWSCLSLLASLWLFNFWLDFSSIYVHLSV